jgi:hypothetical protein
MKSKKIYLSILTVLSSLIILPLISAIEPLNFFENEWIKFAIVFIILFAVMFSFFKPKFNYSSGPTAIVSGGLSILLTIPLMKRGILDSLLSPEIVDWIVIIALIIGIGFLIFWFWRKLRVKGILFLFIILMFIAIFLEDFIPESLMFGPIGAVVQLLQGLGNIAIILLVVIAVFWFIWFFKGLFGGRDRRIKDPRKAERQAYRENRRRDKRARRQMRRDERQAYRENRRRDGGNNTGKAERQAYRENRRRDKRARRQMRRDERQAYRENRKKFEYKQGMRRGGGVSRGWFRKGKPGKINAGSFVGRKATKRYARRFGDRTAKKRFGKGFSGGTKRRLRLKNPFRRR